MVKKIAICFFVSYDSGNLVKERMWEKWLEPIMYMCNIYVHYKKYDILSPFLKKYAIPEKYISKTHYYHMVPAYIRTMAYAHYIDSDNEWFCMATESCVPIVSATEFCDSFYNNHDKSILKWGHSTWNVQFHSRANLKKLPQQYHLVNDPWFILCRHHVNLCVCFSTEQTCLYNTICKGGLANESIFSIILKSHAQLNNNVINASTHIVDWNRRSSATSPYVFCKLTPENVQFICDAKQHNKYAFFLRKVGGQFPE